MKAIKWVLVTVILAGSAFAAWYFLLKDGKKVEYALARLERGDIEAVVSATGSCNAVVSVQVGSQVSGNILELHADYNTKVSKNQVVAVIDPAPFQARVDQARANLESARASVLNAQSQLKKSEADVASSNANVANQKANVVRATSAMNDAKNKLDRRIQMFNEKVVSREDRDTAQANYDQAVASLEAAQAQLTSAQSQLESSKAQLEVTRTQTITAQSQVKQQEANLETAQLDLDHTKIRAPVDGTVIARNMDVGQTVAASFSAPTIFQIAQDLTKMEVDANIDESDISRIQIGQNATFSVDAYPGQTFRGEIRQVRRAPINVQNVITYVVVIGVDNPDMKLFPGMTANVRILTDRVANVLRLPSSALRVRIEGVAAPAKGGEGFKNRDNITRDNSSKEAEAKDGDKKGDQVAKDDAKAGFGDGKGRFGGFANGSAYPGGGFGNGGGGGFGGGGARSGRGGRGGANAGQGGGGGFGEGRGGGRAAGAAQTGTVYVIGEDGKPRAERVRLGIGDGNFVAVLSPNLREGMQVITGIISGGPATAPGFPGNQQKNFKNFKGGFPF